MRSVVVCCGLAILFVVGVWASSPHQGPFQTFFSFRPPFVWGAQGPLPNWDFGGNTVITESYVRLTPDRQSRRGFVWNKNPVHLKAWEIEMEFHVHGQGRHTFGDGFAFWYTRESQQQGPAYGNTMKFNGLGVIFDTFDNDKNRQNPIVMIALNNGTMFDYEHDGAANTLSYCRSDFRNTGKPSKVKIAYLNGHVDVLLAINGADRYTACASAKGVNLPLNGYFGVTAETGDVADNHDIYSFNTYDLSALHSYTPSYEAAEGVPQSSGLGFVFYFIMLLMLGAVGGGAFFVFKRVTARPKTRF